MMLALAVLATACGGEDSAAEDAGAAAEEGDDPAAEEDLSSLEGTIEIDGSSTVEPLTLAVAEEFSFVAPNVAVNVGRSGTGGGFERFCGTGDTQISNASRAIEEEEIAACEDAGIEFTEIRVGTDALTVVGNAGNDFATCLTFDHLRQVYSEGGATNWSELDPEWPDLELAIFGPGADSGTYDFMFEEVLEIVEDPGVRGDFSASENDNDIVNGVAGSEGGIGFFGFAFFQENAGQLKAFEIDGGEGCVAPSVETAQADEYPITRPLFIYIRNDALADPAVAAFAEYYLEIVNDIIEQVGYVPVPDDVLEESRTALEDAISSAAGGA